MAVFSHHKGRKWGKGAKKSRFQEENGNFSNFHLEGVYQCRQKYRTNFAHYNYDRTNDALFLKTIPTFVTQSVQSTLSELSRPLVGVEFCKGGTPPSTFVTQSVRASDPVSGVRILYAGTVCEKK